MSWDEDFDDNKTHGSSGGSNSGGGDGEKKEFPKSILSEGKLALKGYKTEEMDFPPKLQLEVIRNQVHITIWTSVKADTRKPITCRYSALSFFELLQMLEDIEDQPNDTVFSTDNKVPDKEDKRKKVVDTKFHVGKDKNGNFFIAGTAKGCTRVQFTFGYEEYHEFFKNGEPLTKQEASLLQLKAYRKLMYALVPQVLAAKFDPSPKGNWKPGQGKGGGNYNKGKGNYNGGNKGGGDYGSRDKNYDSDVEF